MTEHARGAERFVTVRPRLLWVAENEQCPCEPGQCRHPRVLHVEKGQRAVLLRVVEGERPLEMLTSGDRLAAPEAASPEDSVSNDCRRNVLVLLRPSLELLPQGTRCFVLRTHGVEHPLAIKHGP
jgi:hypothetical protein